MKSKKTNSELTLWAREKLIDWYQKNKRDLPWRKTKEPYNIWISEVMLQQTTVTAVIPYYEKFIRRFPTVKDLALATLDDVYEHWAGLGYYSRARNLHKAAIEIYKQGFPQKAIDLIELPGFGPYTSAAVASLAFNEPVGVLDGNVIRVLSRFYGIKTKWWEPQSRQELQLLSNQLAQTKLNSDLNQGLMELGATVCTPKKVLCLLCPWNKKCVSFSKDLVSQIPLSRPKQAGEIWLWEFQPILENENIFLTANDETPFLSRMMFPPSKAQKLSSKPKDFHFKHGVTKYDIYIRINQVKTTKSSKKVKKNKDSEVWVHRNDVKKTNPTSLMTKILKYLDKTPKI